MNGLAQLQAKQLARKGRYGDNQILHVSDREIDALDGIARLAYGHELPRNPETGAKEAFLFLPMLLPMLASAGVAGLTGLGALGTGALAAGAGVAEAAARGMDNPLEQGLMAGLTAGGGAAIGGALQGLGQGVGDSASLMADLSGAGATANAASAAGNLTSEQMLRAQAQEALAGGLPAADVASFYPSSLMPTATGMPAAGGLQMTQAPIVEADASPLDPLNAPLDFSTIRDVPPQYEFAATQQPAGIAALGDKFSAMGRGVERLAADDKALDQFVSDPNVKYGAMAMGAGMLGSSALDAQSTLNDEMEAEKLKKKKEWDAAYNKIVSNYQAATGSVPEHVRQMTPGGAPYLYAQGGDVFPMLSGGFVMTNKAVKGAGNGSQEKGLRALQKHMGAKPIKGKGTGTSDSIPAKVDGKVPARVSNGEAYIPPAKVKKAGGSRKMYAVMRGLEANRRG